MHYVCVCVASVKDSEGVLWMLERSIRRYRRSFLYPLRVNTSSPKSPEMVDSDFVALVWIERILLMAGYFVKRQSCYFDVSISKKMKKVCEL